jgi:hypothetical protein
LPFPLEQILDLVTHLQTADQHEVPGLNEPHGRPLVSRFYYPG